MIGCMCKTSNVESLSQRKALMEDEIEYCVTFLLQISATLTEEFGGGLTSINKQPFSDESIRMPVTEKITVLSPANFTDQLNNSVPQPSAEEEARNFYVGLLLAIVSTIFIGSSFIFKKKGLLKLAENQGTRAGAGGYGYLKEWMWWAGMILMIVGEFANFAAYAFASATLVAPLGALSVILSEVLSSRILNERLNLLGKVGSAMCVLGSTVVVLHSPKEQEVESIEDLLEKVRDPVFIVMAALLLSVAMFTIIFLSPRYGQKTVIVYIIICSTLGAFTVLGCKGVGVAIKETYRGRNEFTHWLTWVLLGVVVVCILFQLNYLNRALDTYNTAVVTPIYYVFFTSIVIFMSVILYKEWKNMTGVQIATEICGFLTIVGGIFLLQAFKNMNISLTNLPHAKKEPQPQKEKEPEEEAVLQILTDDQQISSS